MPQQDDTDQSKHPDTPQKTKTGPELEPETGLRTGDNTKNDYWKGFNTNPRTYLFAISGVGVIALLFIGMVFG